MCKVSETMQLSTGVWGEQVALDACVYDKRVNMKINVEVIVINGQCCRSNTLRRMVLTC